MGVIDIADKRTVACVLWATLIKPPLTKSFQANVYTETKYIAIAAQRRTPFYCHNQVSNNKDEMATIGKTLIYIYKLVCKLSYFFLLLLFLTSQWNIDRPLVLPLGVRVVKGGKSKFA